MSAREFTQADVKELFNSLLEEEEYFDRLGQLPEAEEEIYKEVAGGRAALMRSAGVQPGAAFVAEVHEGAVSVVYEKLQRYACDYIKAAYLLLQELEVTPEAREFVIILLGASGGNSKQKLVITDKRLSEMTGYTEKTIRTKRHAYREWEARAGWTVIRIHEKPRDRETNQFFPTEYEVLFASHVTEFVKEWRTYYQQRLNQPPAPTEEEGPKELTYVFDDMREERKSTVFAEATSSHVRRQIAERVIGDKMEMSVVPPRNKQQFKSQPKRDEMAAIEAQMLDLLARGRDGARKRGQSAYSWWQDWKRKAANVLAEHTPGFPDPEDEE